MHDQPSTWIYFVETEDGRLVKIGRSCDVIQRLYALQTANPGLRLLGVLPETSTTSESDIHQQFAADHHEGEWFHNSPRMAAYIKSLQQMPLPPRKVYNGVRKRRKPSSKALPGFDHLPVTLRVPGKKAVALLDANYRRVRDYYWHLMRLRTEQKKNDPKIREAKQLMDEMERHARRDHGITVREVILLDR